MSGRVTEVRLPYVSVRKTGGAVPRFAALRRESGRFSMARIALAIALLMIAVPVLVATVYYSLMASPVFISESRFAVRSSIEAPALDSNLDATGTGDGTSKEGVSGGGVGTLGGLAKGLVGSGSTGQQDPFVVTSFLMSREMTQRLDQDGWLRRQYAEAGADRWSRLEEDASQERLFAYWRRHVTAAVDRNSNTIQLRVRAFSPGAAREIALRATRLAEEMIAELTMRQRDDTLALARAQLAEAEARYEQSGLRLQQLRRTTRIVEPAAEAKAAGTTLLRLMYERIRARSELATLERLAGAKAPGRAELLAMIGGLDAQITEANKRLTGDLGDASVLGAIASLEELELERRFALGMLNITSGVFDQALREAQHRSSFLLVYLDPTLPSEAREPRVAISIAFVATLAGIAWIFVLTAIAITLDQLD